MNNIHATQNTRDLDKETRRPNTKRDILEQFRQQVRLYKDTPVVPRQPPLDDLQVAMALVNEYALLRANSFEQVKDVNK